MLKKRLIASLIIKDGMLVQSINFKNYLPIGNPKYTIELISKWDVDEIILIDIDCTPKNKKFDLKKLSEFAKFTSVPLTVGGGIKNINDVKKIISAGADKVCINSIIFKNFNFISEITNSSGSQCVVVCLDIKKNNSEYKIYTNQGKTLINENIYLFIKKITNAGAGEILLNFIDRDGKRNGFDTNFLKKICIESKIPIIAMGGAGKYSDFVKPFIKTEVSALAAANIFHFTEHSTILAKAHMYRNGIDVRLNNDASYRYRNFDKMGRLLALNAKNLSKLLLKPYSK